MKKIPLLLTFTLFFISCSNNSKKEAPTPVGVVRIVAVYIKPDSTGKKGIRTIDVLFREIKKVVQYDSIKGKEAIAVDTFWAYPKIFVSRDSSGKIMYDSLHNMLINTTYTLIHKDSVNWRIENVPYDSLIKN